MILRLFLRLVRFLVVVVAIGFVLFLMILSVIGIKPRVSLNYHRATPPAQVCSFRKSFLDRRCPADFRVLVGALRGNKRLLFG